MSFDVMFAPYRYDGTTTQRLNPFTRKMMDAPRNLPLTTDEVQAVAAVLKRGGPKKGGCYVVRFEDGNTAEVFGDDLSNGCMVALRGHALTTAVAEFLYDILVAGRWVLSSDDTLIAPSRECLLGSSGNPNETITICGSARELLTAFSETFDEWRELRDEIVSETEPGGDPSGVWRNGVGFDGSTQGSDRDREIH